MMTVQGRDEMPMKLRNRKFYQKTSGFEAAFQLFVKCDHQIEEVCS